MPRDDPAVKRCDACAFVLATIDSIPVCAK
jgi:hypothetical protein